MLLIGEVAELSGLSTSAIRYYEQLGLIDTAGRLSGRRVFPDSAWTRLKAITAARDAGFTLEEVRRLLDSQAEGTEDWRALVEEKIRDVEERVQRLGAISAILRESLECGCSAWDHCTLLVPDRPGDRC
jgi:MerR family redox-sensitive transcriptional activator SoxR